MTYPEDELLPLAGLQHLAFCPRQWGLMYLEGIWQDNRLTAQGSVLHETVDNPGLIWKGSILTARAVRIRSFTLGVTGIADIIEFHTCLPELPECTPSSQVSLEGFADLFYAFPVEYKRGRPKIDNWDRIQLCAQAICLEEMLGCAIGNGAIFYGQPRRRESVTFHADLREQTRQTARRMHELWGQRITPRAFFEPKCRSCSILDWCLPPRRTKQSKVDDYLDRYLNIDD